MLGEWKKKSRVIIDTCSELFFKYGSKLVWYTAWQGERLDKSCDLYIFTESNAIWGRWDFNTKTSWGGTWRMEFDVFHKLPSVNVGLTLNTVVRICKEGNHKRKEKKTTQWTSKHLKSCLETKTKTKKTIKKTPIAIQTVITDISMDDLILYVSASVKLNWHSEIMHTLTLLLDVILAIGKLLAYKIYSQTKLSAIYDDVQKQVSKTVVSLQRLKGTRSSHACFKNDFRKNQPVQTEEDSR